MILLLSVRLLDDRFHGLTANGEKPEWPPSPFRLFQAIVAGNARGETIRAEIASALRWLESLGPPDIIAPVAQSGQAILTYVLNNAESRSRAPKTIRPTLLNGDRLIQYAWPFDPNAPGAKQHAETITQSIRHIRALGWGIDMAIGCGEVVEAVPPPTPSRIRFFAVGDSDLVDTDYRLPGPGSLASLQQCHAEFLQRFNSNEVIRLESARPVYRLQCYCSRERRPAVVFKLLDVNEDPYWYLHAKLVHIAGMVRHMAIEQMRAAPPPHLAEEPSDWINRVVRGKRDESCGEDHRQFSYVPLPSIGHEHSDAKIRNVMIIAPLGMDRELEWLAERLNGVLLTPENHSESCDADSKTANSEQIELQRFTPPPDKFIAARYLATSKVWQTVTPVVLDGHNKKSKSDKPEAIGRATAKLIEKALARAGVETPCEFTWQSMPFFKNCLSAHRYDRNGRPTGYFRPKHLSGLTAIHVRLTFTHPVPGPLAIGAGRHCGFGLLAAVNQMRGSH